MLKKLATFLLGFILIFLVVFHPITAFNEDMGRHILLGKIITTSLSVPKTNLLSYTYPEFPFINSHWLSEVVFYYIFSLFSTYGLIVISILTMLLAFGIIFTFLWNKVSTKSLLISMLFYSIIFVERSDIRPEFFSFLFVSLFTVILYKNRDKPTKWIFLLPAIELLWVNTHIYFIIGPLLIFLFLIEPVILNLFRYPTKSSNLKTQTSKLLNTNYKLLATIFLLTCLTTLINPNGLTGALYPLNVLHNYGYRVLENQDIFFVQSFNNTGPLLCFEITVIMLFFLLLLNRKNTRLIDWLLLLTFSFLGCLQIRNTALFIFTTLPSFAISLDSILTHFLKGKNTLTNNILWSILCCVFIWELFFIPSLRGFGLSEQPHFQKAADFYVSRGIKGPIFNNFDLGSYLDYRLYPNQKVFVDNRPEAYPVSFFQNTYLPMQQTPQIFTKIDAQYHFQSIIFGYMEQTEWGKQFVIDISKNPQWQLVYLDSWSAIWVKKEGVNKAIASQYAITEDTFSVPQDKSLSKEDYYMIGYFMSLAGWNKPKIPILQKIVEIDPNDCYALGLLAQYSPSPLLYVMKYQQICH